MALPLPPGLTPPEVAFLCEHELVSVIPRQRLESLDLLSGPTPALLPPRTTPLPLWLALLLHRQRRANIVPPPWLSAPSLDSILKIEMDNTGAFSPSITYPTPSNHDRNAALPSPPFLPTSTSTAEDGHLPYHWIELGETLLTSSPESFSNPSQIRGLLRDLREIRQSKLSAAAKSLEGGGVVSLAGIGAMEVTQERGFLVGVVGGLRLLGSSREATRREEEATAGGAGGADNDEDDDENMEL